MYRLDFIEGGSCGSYFVHVPYSDEPKLIDTKLRLKNGLSVRENVFLSELNERGNAASSLSNILQKLSAFIAETDSLSPLLIKACKIQFSRGFMRFNPQACQSTSQLLSMKIKGKYLISEKDLNNEINTLLLMRPYLDVIVSAFCAADQRHIKIPETSMKRIAKIEWRDVEGKKIYTADRIVYYLKSLKQSPLEELLYFIKSVLLLMTNHGECPKSKPNDCTNLSALFWMKKPGIFSKTPNPEREGSALYEAYQLYNEVFSASNSAENLESSSSSSSESARETKIREEDDSSSNSNRNPDESKMIQLKFSSSSSSEEDDSAENKKIAKSEECSSSSEEEEIETRTQLHSVAQEYADMKHRPNEEAHQTKPTVPEKPQAQNMEKHGQFKVGAGFRRLTNQQPKVNSFELHSNL